MNYKQKYEEALERAKLSRLQLLNIGEEATEIEYIFPELRESEEERIRKILLEKTHQWHEVALSKRIKQDVDDSLKAIGWLEKQGEQDQKHFELKAGHWYICHRAYCCRADHLTVKEGERFMCEKDGVVKGFVIKDPEKYFKEVCAPAPIEDEQKTTDKVGPKFKVGDWVVNKFGDVWHIDSFDKKNYQVSNTDGDYCYFPISKQDEMHLWTIEDAKDGDVLMANAPFIFNGNLEGGIGCPGAHCGINTLGKFQIPKYQEHWTRHTTTPANKEQHDLLFSKMKEAGYVWYAEKKELRKIEQNNSWSEDDEKMLTSTIEYLNEFKEVYQSGAQECIAWLKSLKDKAQPQPKQEWSEEDEKMLNEVINDIKCGTDFNIEFQAAANKRVKWLKTKVKSLKPQQKQEWSEEDKQNLNWVINVWNRLRRGGDAQTTPNQMEYFENWLKSLKDKAQPQPKQEWSEEDEKNWRHCLHYIDAYVTPVKEHVNWYKNIRNRIGWKPSEEQMDELKDVINFLKSNNILEKEMETLYNDLKKL